MPDYRFETLIKESWDAYRSRPLIALLPLVLAGSILAVLGLLFLALIAVAAALSYQLSGGQWAAVLAGIAIPAAYPAARAYFVLQRIFVTGESLTAAWAASRGQGFRTFGVLAAYLLLFILSLILFVFPALVVHAGFLLLGPVLVMEDLSPVDTLKAAWHRMDGWKLRGALWFIGTALFWIGFKRALDLLPFGSLVGSIATLVIYVPTVGIAHGALYRALQGHVSPPSRSSWKEDARSLAPWLLLIGLSFAVFARYQDAWARSLLGKTGLGSGAVPGQPPRRYTEPLAMAPSAPFDLEWEGVAFGHVAVDDQGTIRITEALGSQSSYDYGMAACLTRTVLPDNGLHAANDHLVINAKGTWALDPLFKKISYSGPDGQGRQEGGYEDLDQDMPMSAFLTVDQLGIPYVLLTHAQHRRLYKLSPSVDPASGLWQRQWQVELPGEAPGRALVAVTWEGLPFVASRYGLKAVVDGKLAHDWPFDLGAELVGFTIDPWGAAHFVDRQDRMYRMKSVAY